MFLPAQVLRMSNKNAFGQRPKAFLFDNCGWNYEKIPVKMLTNIVRMTAMQGQTPERVITPIKMAALQVSQLISNYFARFENKQREYVFHDFFPGFTGFNNRAAGSGILAESSQSRQPKKRISHRSLACTIFLRKMHKCTNTNMTVQTQVQTQTRRSSVKVSTHFPHDGHNCSFHPMPSQ